MGTSDEDRIVRSRHPEPDPDPEMDPQQHRLHFAVAHARFASFAPPDPNPNPAHPDVRTTKPFQFDVTSMPMSNEADGDPSLSPSPPKGYPYSYPMQLPPGPVATPITRFLSKQTLGFIPKAAPLEPSAIALPPLQKSVSSSITNPVHPLPSLAQCLDDVCRPMRYQRSLSCPSDAMARVLQQQQQARGAVPVMPPPDVVLRLTDARMSRLERSSSMDSHGVPPYAYPEMPRAVAYRSDSMLRPEAIDLHQWLRLESLAASANMQDKMNIGLGMSSPRGVGTELLHYDSPGTHSTASDPRREKKLCAFPECTSNAVTRGLCISHGGGRRCQRKGCTRGAQSKGLCVAHGGGRICKARGCSNIQRSMGLCIRHGGGKRCSVPGCQKGVVRQDLCTAHGGKRKCRVDGCNKHVKKKGLCRAHANAAAMEAAPVRGLENLHVSQ